LEGWEKLVTEALFPGRPRSHEQEKWDRLWKVAASKEAETGRGQSSTKAAATSWNVVLEQEDHVL
jgi:hypothetical protein